MFTTQAFNASTKRRAKKMHFLSSVFGSVLLIFTYLVQLWEGDGRGGGGGGGKKGEGGNMSFSNVLRERFRRLEEGGEMWEGTDGRCALKNAYFRRPSTRRALMVGRSSLVNLRSFFSLINLTSSMKEGRGRHLHAFRNNSFPKWLFIKKEKCLVTFDTNRKCNSSILSKTKKLSMHFNPCIVWEASKKNSMGKVANWYKGNAYPWHLNKDSTVFLSTSFSQESKKASLPRFHK